MAVELYQNEVDQSGNEPSLEKVKSKAQKRGKTSHSHGNSDPTSRTSGGVKGAVQNIVFSIQEWRRLQNELRMLPDQVGEVQTRVLDALSEYRLAMVDLSFKAETVDKEVWDLYTSIQATTPLLKKETFKRALFLNRRQTLQAYRAGWQELIDRQNELLEVLSRAPAELEHYDRIEIMRQQEQEDRQKYEASRLKIEAAQQLLEIALSEAEENSGTGELLSVDSKFLRFKDARQLWAEQFDEIMRQGQAKVGNPDDTILRIRRLEETVRGAPFSARWIRSTEQGFSKLVASHDVLLRLGKNVIPQADLARNTVLLYEQVPQLWAQGENDELKTAIQSLEKFITYYQGQVQHELDLAERQRPGVTRALIAASTGTNEILAPLIQVTRSLVEAVDSRDQFMSGHSVKVTELAVKTARRLNWNEQDLQYLEIAALLHDVGKLYVSEDILKKTGPLTEQERGVIEKHPLQGANIVKPVVQLNKIVPWIYHHQEHWDGRGYPDRLSGRDIPLGASIISVAEAYSVMTLDLPYRVASTKPQVLSSLQQEAGKQFNPEVVEAFVEAVEE